MQRQNPYQERKKVNTMDRGPLKGLARLSKQDLDD